MKKVYNITFSPTGGTKRVADELTKPLASDSTWIDLTRRNQGVLEMDADDLAIISVPSYGGRVPALAIERLKSVTGYGANAVLVAVYGNRAYEDTLVELQDVAKDRGFKVLAGVAAVARHSIVTEIASERPDATDKAKLAEFGEKIKAKLERGPAEPVSLPGNRPYKRSGGGLTPKTDKRKCNECGKCAVECPSGAIHADNPKALDADLCINCMRCVNICPSGAKCVSGLMVWLVGKALKKPCKERKEVELFI